MSIMYDYRNLQPRAEPTNKALPIEALCYDGKWLDDEIDEYTTLVVEGRGGFEREINAPSRAGDGDLYLTSRIKSRKLTVIFALNCKNVETYNVAIAKLNQLTHIPNADIKFADDRNYHYIGTITNISFDSPLLATTGKIEIECSDPYRYSDPKTITSTGNVLSISDGELSYKQTPKLVEFTPTYTVSKFEMKTNAGKVLTVNETIGSGAKLIIDFNALTIKVNNVSRLMALKLTSNFSDFYIQHGSQITLNSSGQFKMIYEVKRL